jgi:hypothetical protein
MFLPRHSLGDDTVVRIATSTASLAGACDHCKETREPTPPSAETVTVVTLHREDAAAVTTRFCERHFLLFSDLVNDHVAALLYPKRPAPA